MDTFDLIFEIYKLFLHLFSSTIFIFQFAFKVHNYKLLYFLLSIVL